MVEGQPQLLVLPGELRYRCDRSGRPPPSWPGSRSGGDDAFGALALGDVGGELDDLDRLARGIEDRVVGGLDPDLLAALAEALELAGDDTRPRAAAPRTAIFGAAGVGRVAEHAVMLARRSRRAGSRPSPRKFSLASTIVPSRLNSITACDAARSRRSGLVIGGAVLLLGDVGGELDDLDRLARLVEDRIVGRLDPDLAPALGDAPVLAGLELARGRARPRTARIRRSRGIGRIDEHAVVLADDLARACSRRPRGSSRWR